MVIAPIASEPAGVARRLAAAAYDLLPLAALWMAGTALIMPFAGGGEIAPRTFAYQAWLFAIAFVYYTLSWQRGGQTIGMRAWRIRVVSGDATTMTWARMGLRFGVALVALAALGAGVFAGVLDARRRMWHDRAARTEVVLVPKRAP